MAYNTYIYIYIELTIKKQSEKTNLSWQFIKLFIGETIKSHAQIYLRNWNIWITLRRNISDKFTAWTNKKHECHVSSI